MKDKLPRKNTLKTVRDIIACSVFIMAVLLFMNWGDLFAKAFGFIAKAQLWPAVMAVNVGVLVLLVVLTMLFGRIYCSVLCPWGLLQDGIRRSDIAVRRVFKKAGGSKRRLGPIVKLSSRARNWIRYSILAVYLSLIAFGLGSIAYLIEPYSNFGVLMAVIKGRALLPVIIVAIVTLAVLVSFVALGGRIWCNTVCPVGALLGLLSRKSLFRPVISSEKCVSCGLCAKECRASCIDLKNHSVDMSSCVMCLDCLDVCNKGAIKYGWGFAGKSSGHGSKEITDVSKDTTDSMNNEPTPSMSRRAFLGATAIGVGALAKAQMHHNHLDVLQERVAPQRMTPLVPAGAKSLKNFYDHCIGCQLCISVCPNKVLRPIVEFNNFMKPTMSYESGFCDPECRLCSTVCPTGAISKLASGEKYSISIGQAEYSPFACLINTEGIHCGRCARACPVGAISMEVTSDLWGDSSFGDSTFSTSAESDSSVETLPVPHVNTDRCIGCGRCEFVCPARPQSAIYVEGHSEHIVR